MVLKKILERIQGSNNLEKAFFPPLLGSLFHRPYIFVYIFHINAMAYDPCLSIETEFNNYIHDARV